ncbi:hypothetical protein PLICRDRAFT_481171 [Plicaturopsis crispa FD-325 SS-3]|nr:hypothetical protein PLICRDRAFT_481171 [Plicaturopsis crispa FD-325 SS-3]
MYATRSEHHTTYQYVDFDYCGANALQVAADTLSLPAPKRELSVVELSLGLSRDDMLDILQAETSQGDASEPLQDDVPEPLQDDVLELSYDDMPEPLQDDVLSQEDIDSAQNTTATPPIDFDSQRTLVDADINASEQDRTLPSGSSKSYPEKTTWTPELSEAIPYISRYGRRVKSATKEPAEVTSRAEAGRSSQKRKRNEKENDGPSSEVSTREPLTDPKTRPRPRPRYRQWNDDSSQGTPLLGPRQSYQAAPPVNPHSFASSSLSTYEERELVDSSDEGTQYHDHSDHAPSPHLRASSTLPTYKERDLDDPFDEGTQDHDQSDEPNPYSRASSIVSILVPLNDADSFNDGTPAPESFDEGTSRHYNDDTPNYQLRASSILSMGVPYNDKNPFYGGSPVPEHPGIGQFDQIPQASEPPCPIRDFLANIGRPQLRPALLDAGVRTATDLRGLARMDACELKGMLERWREGWVFTDGGEVEAVFTGLQRLKTVGA